jgi:5-methylcytosine-specific restriction endonuclease McrA
MRLADERRGNFRERGYTGAWSRYSKTRLLLHALCVDPFHVHGELGAFAEVTDHIVPLWAGGELMEERNLQSLCTACNLRKAADDTRRYRKAGR